MILPQTVTELCASLPATLALLTFVPYLVAFYSRPEAPTYNDFISGSVVESVSMDARATLIVGSGLNIGRIIRLFGQLESFCALLYSI